MLGLDSCEIDKDGVLGLLELRVWGLGFGVWGWFWVEGYLGSRGLGPDRDLSITHQNPPLLDTTAKIVSSGPSSSVLKPRSKPPTPQSHSVRLPKPLSLGSSAHRRPSLGVKEFMDSKTSGAEGPRP